MNEFLYILNQNSYLKKLKEEKIYKYIPNIFFNKFDILTEPKILEEFKYENNTIGYKIGLTTIKNIDDDKIIEKIEKLIKKDLAENNISSIIFEDGYNYALEDKLIKNSILRPNNYSKEIKIKIIPFIIKKMIQTFYQLQEDIELLIIYDKEYDLKNIVDKIPFKIKNIYIYKENKAESIKISDEVLKTTGLSIGVIDKEEKINKFDIIINFKDDINFINRVKKNGIVFNIYNNITYEEKKPIVIDDFIFSNKTFKTDLDFKLSSSIYSYQDKFKISDLIEIKANGDLYSLEKLCKLSNYNIS